MLRRVSGDAPEMTNREESFDYEALIRCANAELFGPGNAQLPMPPMLMVDRITSITADGGPDGKGQIVAEFEIKPDLWFFKCHFPGDPVMPGCLGASKLGNQRYLYLFWCRCPSRIGLGSI